MACHDLQFFLFEGFLTLGDEMQVLLIDELLLVGGGHGQDEPCDGHDHDHHHYDVEHTAPRSYHFDFSDWF